MRFHTLSPNTRHGLLAAGLFLIGVSTAVGLGVPEPVRLTGEHAVNPAEFHVPEHLAAPDAALETARTAGHGETCTARG